MIDMIPDANPVKRSLRSLEHLTAYATAYRYPSPVGRISPTPARQDIDATAVQVEVVLLDLAARFGVDLVNATAPARTSAPIR